MIEASSKVWIYRIDDAHYLRLEDGEKLYFVDKDSPDGRGAVEITTTPIGRALLEVLI